MNNASLHMKKRYRVDLRGLMARCEENYARLMRLLGMLADDQHSLRLAMHDSGQHELCLTVQERCRYTTMVELEISPVHDALPRPRLCVRLYHDARLAEVTEASPWRRADARYDYPNQAMHQKDEKQQWNQFLSDWLRHVQDQGHLAEPVWSRA